MTTVMVEELKRAVDDLNEAGFVVRPQRYTWWVEKPGSPRSGIYVTFKGIAKHIRSGDVVEFVQDFWNVMHHEK